MHFVRMGVRESGGGYCSSPRNPNQYPNTPFLSEISNVLGRFSVSVTIGWIMEFHCIRLCSLSKTSAQMQQLRKN
jgi:hypothetical protein